MSTIAVDAQIKDRAAKKAKSDRIPLGIVTRILLEDYARGQITIGTRAYTPFYEEDIQWIRDHDEQFGPFESAQKGIDFLHSLPPTV
ncbi:MAG: hypothetical protein WCJ84_01465 [Candidatus Peregrinibacteria bacterium]